MPSPRLSWGGNKVYLGRLSNPMIHVVSPTGSIDFLAGSAFRGVFSLWVPSRFLDIYLTSYCQLDMSDVYATWTGVVHGKSFPARSLSVFSRLPKRKLWKTALYRVARLPLKTSRPVAGGLCVDAVSYIPSFVAALEQADQFLAYFLASKGKLWAN